MNPIRKFRCAIGLLAFMLASAACALAQAEINPDHFDDAPQQTPAVKRAALLPGTPHALPASKAQRVKQQTASRAGTATQGSAQASAKAATAGSIRPGNSKDLPQSDLGKRKKKLISEARHHATP